MCVLDFSPCVHSTWELLQADDFNLFLLSLWILWYDPNKLVMDDADFEGISGSGRQDFNRVLRFAKDFKRAANRERTRTSVQSVDGK